MYSNLDIVAPSGLMRLPADIVVQQRYRIQQLLAQEVSSITYLALDELLQRSVVLQQLRSHEDAPIPGVLPPTVQQLVHLRHAALPPVLDVLVTSQGQFLVLETSNAPTLEDLLQEREQPFTWPKATAWFCQLLDLLIYLHAQSPPVIHGHIQPKCIQCTAAGRLMLRDYGPLYGRIQIAEPVLRDTDVPVPSPYAGIEQIQGEYTDSDPRSDLYGLGTTWYYLLTGMAPIDAVTRGSLVIEDQLDPLVGLNLPKTQMSPAVHDLFLSLLALLPDDRPASALAVRSTLLALQTPEPISQRPDTVVVDPQGGAHYTSIQQAISDSPAGMRIVIRPGIYQESLVLDRPVIIEGDEDPSQVVVTSVNAPVVTMQASYAEIHRLTLHSQTTSDGTSHYGVDIGTGRLTLDRCSISSASLACVAIHGPEADPLLRQCHIRQGIACGILIYAQASGVIDDCDITDHHLAGVEICQRSNPLIRNCRIKHNGNYGILVHSRGSGRVVDCDMTGNRPGPWHIQSGNVVYRERNRTRTTLARVNTIAGGIIGGSIAGAALFIGMVAVLALVYELAGPNLIALIALSALIGALSGAIANWHEQ